MFIAVSPNYLVKRVNDNLNLTVKMKRSINASVDKEDLEVDLDGRCAGTVRRHTPTDTRDQPGAIVHFYVGDSYDSNR